MPGPGQTNQEFHLDLPHGWQVPKFWGHLPLLFQAHEQEAELEAEQPGLEPVLQDGVSVLQVAA